MQSSLGKIGVGLGLGCLLFSITMILYLGQTSLVALTGCLGAIYFSQHQKFLIASLFIILASVKPHLSLLPVLYLLIQTRSLHLLVWSSIFVGITNVGVIMLGGGLNLLPDFLNSIITHTGHTGNLPYNLPGLYAIMGSMGFNYGMISIVSAILCLIFLVMLVLLLRKQNTQTNFEPVNNQSLLLIALTFGMTAVLMPLHITDYVIFFPVIVMLVAIKWYNAIFLLPGILLVIRPNNVANLLHSVADMPASSVMVASVGAVYVTVAIATLVVWESLSFSSHMKETI